MIYNKIGETYIFGGKILTVGEMVKTNENSEYPGLYGTLTEIRDGDDIETDNDFIDIYCSFELPVLPHEVERIEKKVSQLYGKIKESSELGLDNIIMAPEMLEPIHVSNSYRNIDAFIVTEIFTTKDNITKKYHIVFSKEEAILKIRDIVREAKASILADYYDDIYLSEKSNEYSYSARYNDGYTKESFEVEISEVIIPLSDEVKRKIAGYVQEENAMEDLLSRLDSSEIVMDTDKRKKIESMSDISERIEHQLYNCDAYWEYYWDAVDKTISNILEEI